MKCPLILACPPMTPPPELKQDRLHWQGRSVCLARLRWIMVLAKAEVVKAPDWICPLLGATPLYVVTEDGHILYEHLPPPSTYPFGLADCEAIRAALVHCPAERPEGSYPLHAVPIAWLRLWARVEARILLLTYGVGSGDDRQQLLTEALLQQAYVMPSDLRLLDPQKPQTLTELATRGQLWQFHWRRWMNALESVPLREPMRCPITW